MDEKVECLVCVLFMCEFVVIVLISHAGKDYPVQASTRDEMLVWLKSVGDAVVGNHN